MCLSCVHPPRYVHALFPVIGDTIWPFSLSECNLIEVKTANRLTGDLLLKVQVVCMDFKQLDSLFILLRSDQRGFFGFISLYKLQLKLAHPIFGSFDCDFFHLTRRQLILSQLLSVLFILPIHSTPSCIDIGSLFGSKKAFFLHRSLLLLLIDNDPAIL